MASITITDVAQRAGVSMKTVSRVLNGERHVRPELRDRVLAAARELRYRPKLSARSLAGRRSYVICNLLEAVNPYGVAAQQGALEACRAEGYHLVLELFDPHLADPARELDLLISSLPMDGMLLMPPICDNDAVLATLEAAGVPYVRVAPSKRSRRSPYIDIDDEGAGRAMTEHLLDLGHRRIGFVEGMPGHGASVRRLRGYRAALAARGVPAADELVAPGFFIFESGRQAADRLLSLPDPPTAIFASNDLSAAGVMARARELGHQVPRTLSVAGVDDIPTAAMLSPGLTTMRQPIAEMAAAAVGMLIDAAAGRTPTPRAAFTTELIVRGSTARPSKARRG